VAQNRTEAMPAALAGYAVQADGWQHDRYDSMRKQRNWAIGIAAAACIGVAGAGVGIAALAPLKTTEPYLLVHDTSTGQINELTQLRKNPEGFRSVAEDDAVISSYLVPYIIARETYDKVDYKQRAQTVQVFSDARAYADYDAQFRSSDERVNPFFKYRDEKVKVDVMHVAFLNSSTAQVRYAATWQRQVGAEKAHYVATITFSFSNAPTEIGVRWRNPLGFQVTSYRNDQEVINNG